MKTATTNLVTFIAIGLMFSMLSCSQANDQPNNTSGDTEENEEALTTAFNQQLAKELQADEYGMHQYVMAFLKRGPTKDLTKEEAQKLQAKHLENISRMAEEGVLVVAGPFLDDGEIRGIYIFDVETIEEAKALTETDPAIQAGSLVMELKPWYGSAALLKVNEIHQQVAKKNP